ncbi:hypothetical protein TL16_g03160 [Triparma laevis f. inornata]|uniref:FAD/NAD(P)-binding domain-containing protein n=1 Tax=Triparma laevis f. inornata TaxID=1714386 RepID=A0A9W7A1I2_9STRA|nr:hypothetical protein TL16_g03160 [Triparma laevis f. inornata]
MIIGCGPAGLQAGLQASKLNISYLILEQTAHCGSFFDTYPRLGKLISFNKPNPPGPLPEWNQDDYDDYKLRFDWHTLLASPLPPFPTLTNQFYPDADIFRSYLQRSSQTLNIVFETEVSQVTKNSVTLKKNGTVLEASAVILSTGMTPKPLSESESAIYNYTFPNADHYTYESAPLSCSVYESKHVFIYGSGNAANELSNHVIQNCAAMRTWVLGRRPIKSSFLTQYVGDVRSGNMLAVESYKLKSLDAVFEGKDYTDITLYQHIKMLEHGYGVKPTTSSNVVVIYATGFTSQPLNTNTQYNNNNPKKYPHLHTFNKNDNDVYITGAAAHKRDYRVSSSGFVHGFRYTTLTTLNLYNYIHNNVMWPYLTFESYDDVLNHMRKRFQTSSALWHLQKYYCDVVLDTGEKTFLYIESVPVGGEMDFVSAWVEMDYMEKSGKNEKSEQQLEGRDDDVIEITKLLQSYFLRIRDYDYMFSCNLPRQSLSVLETMKICKPEFFERFSISLNSGRVVLSTYEQLGLNFGLKRGEEILLVDSGSETSVLLNSYLPMTRAVLTFEYEDGFHGYKTVYEEGRIGAGFIAPTLRLEDDPRNTPFSGVRNYLSNNNTDMVWRGWSKFKEREDLFARWDDFERLDECFFQYVEEQEKYPATWSGRVGERRPWERLTKMIEEEGGGNVLYDMKEINVGWY